MKKKIQKTGKWTGQKIHVVGDVVFNAWINFGTAPSEKKFTKNQIRSHTFNILFFNEWNLKSREFNRKKVGRKRKTETQVRFFVPFAFFSFQSASPDTPVTKYENKKKITYSRSSCRMTWRQKEKMRIKRRKTWMWLLRMLTWIHNRKKEKRKKASRSFSETWIQATSSLFFYTNIRVHSHPRLLRLPGKKSDGKKFCM